MLEENTDETNSAPAKAGENSAPVDSPETERAETGTKNALDDASGDLEKAPAPKKKKPRNRNRTPQLHTDEEFRGMLAALQAEYPEMSYKDIAKYALSVLCDYIGYLPPIRLRRLAAQTLRTMAGAAANLEKNTERAIRKIIKAKLDPAIQAKLTDELEVEVAALRELRQTMMRQAAIPMTPELPDHAQTCIEALAKLKLASTDKSDQDAYETGIVALKAYRSPEYDLPECLRDPLG